MTHRWTDSGFSDRWAEQSHLFAKVPKFRVRTDVEAESGKIPVRTGVYVPQNDPYGSLQFAWTGNSDGRLFDCSTFNELGLQALNTVGRDALWTDDPRLLPIVKQPKYLAGFKELDWFKEPNFLNDPTRPQLYISSEGIFTRPCKWYFVEMVNGEYEDLAELEAQENTTTTGQERIRAEAGLPCPREGYYFTPARIGSRRFFKQGEIMPEVGGDYGATIWQWDGQQD
jgi:hypothetical protein